MDECRVKLPTLVVGRAESDLQYREDYRIGLRLPRHLGRGKVPLPKLWRPIVLTQLFCYWFVCLCV